ncbi:MAG: ABC transporter substrate-binding protein [Hyphomicrobiales bacterium]|nr:ABC transporter substrate-binding protein [Hyphomicrobiales bacterium]MDE2283515.1 ABC transporter substrate-binding protein [Hyphomicrobiales bacterium]MDE2373016.1 ABC transporter substrate-binding protein [Hyphomicrobiales bacterium]
MTERNGVRSGISRRSFGRIAAGLAGAAALGGTANLVGSRPSFASFKGSRPYKIGFVAPLTGPVAPEGSSMQKGFNLGLETINAAGGIAGHPVVAVTQDTQAVPAVAGTVVKKFIQEEKVDMIVGTITGDEEEVASKICAAAGIPVLFPEAGFWYKFCNSTTVMLGENSFDLCAPLVPFMAEKFGKKFLLIGSDFSFPHAYLAVAKHYISQIGGTVVGEFYAPLGTADWSSNIAKIKSAKPDVIFSGVVGGDAIGFVKQAQSLGLLPGAHLTGVNLQPEFYPAMGDAVDGQYAAVRYSEDIKTAANEKFKEAYHKKYGPAPIPLVGTTAFYSFDFIKAAVEKAGTYDPKAVFAAFKGVEAETILSDKPLRVDPNTMNIGYPMYITQIQKGGLYKIVKDVGLVKNDLKCEGA